METPPDICLACGDGLSPPLVRSGSLRCHDCRDVGAPLSRQLVKRYEPALTRRLRRRLRPAA